MNLPETFNEGNVYLIVEWDDPGGITVHFHCPPDKPGVSSAAFAKMLRTATKVFATTVQESMKLPNSEIEHIEANISEYYNQFLQEDSAEIERL